MDLIKASDKVPQGVLWVCGGNMGNQGRVLSHPVLEYSSKRVINKSLLIKLKEFKYFVGLFTSEG